MIHVLKLLFVYAYFRQWLQETTRKYINISLMLALYSSAFESCTCVWINMAFYFVQLRCVYHIQSRHWYSLFCRLWSYMSTCCFEIHNSVTQTPFVTFYISLFTYRIFHEWKIFCKVLLLFLIFRNVGYIYTYTGIAQCNKMTGCWCGGPGFVSRHV